ncbi:CBS domain-containing protein [Pedomonas mirosovicensis]|uniref:CBS domain-containing protein n=1 Tax=Pedomonas mirosovicensis TaxID=2908641 RepID=UPI002168CA1B|nr:CBS domain-containing protein [Pedomonas mirosovicensis]MCH8686044.1 CBS domain-containing protein [Pedomonas mirosovicensis]
MALFTRTPLFTDRKDAGHRLGYALLQYRHENPLVLALPRGGVPVGLEVANILGAELDVALVRKIGAPGAPELALGAVVDGNPPQTLLNEDVVQLLKPSPEYIEARTREEIMEIERRRALYREGRPPLRVRDRTIILVDDGIATGATTRVVLRSLRQAGARKVVLAVPVAPRETLESLELEADDTVCLATPEPFHAVGLAYAHFDQTSDAEVIEALANAAPPTILGGTVRPPAVDYSPHSSTRRFPMKVADIMTRDVTVVSPNDSARRAAQIMDELNVGVLPVCDGRRIVGMVTDRDLTVRVTALGKNPESCRVEEAMSSNVRWCFEDEDVESVIEKMGDTQIRRVPVVDRDHNLVGIVSLGDIATKSDEVAEEALEGISEPSEPDR